MSASESAFAEEPVQTTCQMEEPSHPVFETGAEDQPIVQPSQHPEWFSQPRKPPTPNLYKAATDQLDWVNPEGQQYPHNLLQPLSLIPDNRGRRRKGDKDRATAMIQAIDKMLKTKRIMRSLERFVGGRQYEGDFRMLQ
nr:hypothetical protein [Tanacetum cinerariifolium]